MQTALPASSVTAVSRTNTFVLSLNECIHPEWQWRGYLFLRRLLKFQLVRWSNISIKRERASKNSTSQPLSSSWSKCLTHFCCGYGAGVLAGEKKKNKYLLSSLSLPLCAWEMCVFPSPASTLSPDTSYILCSCIALWSYRWRTKPQQLSQNCSYSNSGCWGGLGWVFGSKGSFCPAICYVVNASDYLHDSQGGHGALGQFGCIPLGWASLWALGLPKHRVSASASA